MVDSLLTLGRVRAYHVPQRQLDHKTESIEPVATGKLYVLGNARDTECCVVQCCRVSSMSEQQICEREVYKIGVGELRYDYDESRLNNSLNSSTSRQSAEETFPLSNAGFRLLPPLAVALPPRLPVLAPALDRLLLRAGLGAVVPSSISFPDSCGPGCTRPE